MKTERIFVRVNTDFDPTGYLQPKAIIWKDGRVFRIEAIRDLRPYGSGRDRFTVLINGELRYLYYEKPSELLPNHFGR